MIYRVTFTHGPDYEFVLASVTSMARLRAWSAVGAIFLFVDPSRPFTPEQCESLRKFKCHICPTPLMTGVFTGPTFNWSWEGIYIQLLAYRWMSMLTGISDNDYVMRADSDTVFTSSRFFTYTQFGGHYLGKGNDRTFDTPQGAFRPTEGPCVLMKGGTFHYLANLTGLSLATLRAEWPGLPLVDDVFFSWCAFQQNSHPPITYFDSSEWYTGTSVEEFQVYLNNGQLPGPGFLFHWLGHLKHPVKPMLASVNWLPEPT